MGGQESEDVHVSDSLKTISALSLFVENVQEAKAFYRDVFGVSVVYEDGVSAALEFDNLIINLLQASEAFELVAPGSVAARDAGSRFQLSIWVEDVDAVCTDLASRGVAILNGPTDKPWGMRVATFVDPAGHSWEVAQNLNQR
jgi:catechol 2,3-dioxygenase-like lactoylglutathione lyase family enzyme